MNKASRPAHFRKTSAKRWMNSTGRQVCSIRRHSQQRAPRGRGRLEEIRASFSYKCGSLRRFARPPRPCRRHTPIRTRNTSTGFARGNPESDCYFRPGLISAGLQLVSRHQDNDTPEQPRPIRSARCPNCESFDRYGDGDCHSGHDRHRRIYESRLSGPRNPHGVLAFDALDRGRRYGAVRCTVLRRVGCGAMQATCGPARRAIDDNFSGAAVPITDSASDSSPLDVQLFPWVLR